MSFILGPALLYLTEFLSFDGAFDLMNNHDVEGLWDGMESSLK